MKKSVVTLMALAGVLVASLDHVAVVSATRARVEGAARDDDDRIVTVDHFVPHVSTVFANAGERVQLFVRERVRKDEEHHRRVVLMIHGRTISTVPVFDLRFDDYSWMHFLARAGFDVFAMDQQGYGLSARPTMNDPCNTALSEQKLYLIPHPLAAPCLPSYPFNLTTIQSDWDEIDAVVDYLRELRHVEKVSLAGWSLAGPRAGGYTARHPEKIQRLFLYAPAYKRLAPDNPPAPLPQPGVPMTVLGSANLHDNWQSMVHCDGQFAAGIRDVITSTIFEFDPVGRMWGSTGVRRSPIWSSGGNGFAYWGWNAHFAGQIHVPTLVIRGDLDTQVPFVDAHGAFEDLGTDHKVFVHVACASHYLVWETQHMALLHASREWLRNGTFLDQTMGSFFVDTNGVTHQE